VINIIQTDDRDTLPIYVTEKYHTHDQSTVITFTLKAQLTTNIFRYYQKNNLVTW